MGNIFIVDDNLSTCTMLKQMIERMGHEAKYCQQLASGIQRIQSEQFDVVFLDVNMPDGNGLTALEKIRKMYNPPEVIIITGAGDKDGAEIAIKNGAWGYLQKPLSPKEILLPIKRVIEYRENLSLTSKYLSLVKREEIVGNSPLLNHCLEQLARAAENDTNVLITGETGTGKDVFARVLHDNSRRRENRLITVDCASLPENLIADTLFGHEKGAYTGAEKKTTGLVQLADGGSLFLDEIGDLDLSLQKSLLRVLQEKKFFPIGGTKEVVSDFRLIAATNRDLKKMISQGTFREDLYYRIYSQSIKLPPLRSRKDDIEVLMTHFIRKMAEKYKQDIKGYSPDFLETLMRYNWPGNVREFIHVIENSFHTAASEPILFAKHLPENLRIKAISTNLDIQSKKIDQEVPTIGKENLPTLKSYRESVLAQAEKKYLSNLMSVSNGNKKLACEIADIGRTRLYNLLKKHMISGDKVI